MIMSDIVLYSHLSRPDNAASLDRFVHARQATDHRVGSLHRLRAFACEMGRRDEVLRVPVRCYHVCKVRRVHFLRVRNAPR